MATTTLPRTAAPHMGTTDPSGSTAVCSSELALGSTAPTTSAATLITASTHITATLVHIRSVEIRPSIISAVTRCVMDAATQAVEATQVGEATQVVEATQVAEAIASGL